MRRRNRTLTGNLKQRFCKWLRVPGNGIAVLEVWILCGFSITYNKHQISFSVLSCLKQNENPSPFVTHSGKKTLPPTAPHTDSFWGMNDWFFFVFLFEEVPVWICLLKLLTKYYVFEPCSYNCRRWICFQKPFSSSASIVTCKQWQLCTKNPAFSA